MFDTIKKLFSPVKSLTAEEARDFMENHPVGSYTLLDVRQPKEYEESHIAGAKLAPLPQLSDFYKDLNREMPIIVYCAIGGRSRVAAQMLAGNDFVNVFNLTGGIKSWNGVSAQGPQEMNMEMITGDETPSEVIALAYTMENNLGHFYQLAQKKVSDSAVIKLLGSLASVEEKHKVFLAHLFEKLDPDTGSRESLDALALSTTMEGGFDTDAFLKANSDFLAKETDILDLAMMLETQALDLYIRFAGRMKNADSRETLNIIANEEKAHLAALGDLRNNISG